MDRNGSIYRIMGALLALDIALLTVSGIPAVKDAGSGWKLVVGDVSWGGFLVVAVGLIALAAGTLVRRARTSA
jgi:hypothetical protein